MGGIERENFLVSLNQLPQSIVLIVSRAPVLVGHVPHVTDAVIVVGSRNNRCALLRGRHFFERLLRDKSPDPIILIVACEPALRTAHFPMQYIPLNVANYVTVNVDLMQMA
jgi:hypothetical protein